jgi:hypothetical protein
MNSDFGAEVDAALSGHMTSLQSAAEEARSRVDQAASALPQPQSDPRFVIEPSPIVFHEPSPGAPAVSFEGMGDEYELEADTEGIPLPEENL